jgi:uroporphyrin-3 C-methyltransferase
VVSLVALGVAVAVAGYVWVEQRSGLGQRVAALAADVSARGSEMAALAARVDEYSVARRRLDDDLERLQERVTRDTEVLATLPARLDKLEENVERFAGTGDRVRAAWLLAEAEHYMRMANAQLGLAGDVRIAQTSLELADDTLRELGDPRFTPVRKQLAAELAALKAVPQPDTEGVVLALGTLSDSLESLPLKQSARAVFREQASVAETAGPAGPVERAWAALKAALTRLVSIRRVDQPVTPLLTDAERSVLVRSLDLELQLARLAVMRGDAGMYRRSVEAATARVEQHFDPAAPDVQVALETLRGLGSVALPEELPDISGSLAALLKATGGPGA